MEIEHHAKRKQIYLDPICKRSYFPKFTNIYLCAFRARNVPCQSLTYLRNRFHCDVCTGVSLSIRKIFVLLRLIQLFVHLSVARVRL